MYGWERYIGIERDFISAKFYVSFGQENVYSEFFTREIILLGTEIEAALKELCKRIDGSTAGNMCEYKNIILTAMPKITQIAVIEKNSGRCCYPFYNWDVAKLDWWDVYTGVKHNLVDEKANLGVALKMLQAYELLLFCITAIKEDVHINSLEMPKMYNVIFPMRGEAILANLDHIIIYERKEILKALGYKQSTL